MLDGSFYRGAFWNGKTDTKSFIILFLLLIQQFYFTNHNFILFKFHLVEVFYFYFRWIILHYNEAGTVSWAGRNSRSRRGCNPQHMKGEQLYLSVIIPLHLSRDAASSGLHPLRIRTHFGEKTTPYNYGQSSHKALQPCLQGTARQLNFSAFAVVEQLIHLFRVHRRYLYN